MAIEIEAGRLGPRYADWMKLNLSLAFPLTAELLVRRSTIIDLKDMRVLATANRHSRPLPGPRGPDGYHAPICNPMTGSHPANSNSRSDLVITFEEAGVARCKCIGAGFGLLVGSFLLAIGILFIYQIAQHDYHKPLYQNTHIEESQILVQDDIHYVLDNLTGLKLNSSDLLDPLWFPEYEYDYSSVREGERYAGPALAVLGAIVFLLSLSLCMWLKISGKIIILQSDDRIISMQESSPFRAGTVIANSAVTGEAIPLETFAHSSPSPTALRASRSPRHARYSPAPSPSRSPRHGADLPPNRSPPPSLRPAAIPSYEQVSQQNLTPSTTPHLCRHHRRVQSALASTGSPVASPLFARPASEQPRQSSLRIPSSSCAASPARPLRSTLPPNAPPPAYADVFPN